MIKARLFILLAALFTLLYFSVPRLTSKAAIFLNNKAIDYYDLGQHERAVAFYRMSLWIKQDAQTYSNLANVYHQMGMVRETIQACNMAIKIDPDFAQPYYELADTYREREEYDNALFYLEKAHRLGFAGAKAQLDSLRLEYAASLTNKAVDFYEEGDMAQAKRKLREAIGFEPDFLLAHKMFGDILAEENQLRQALRYYKKCVELGLEDINIYNNIGVYHMQFGEYQQAVHYLRLAYQLQPENPVTIYNLASTLRDKKNFTEALNFYKELLRLRQDYPNAHNDIAGIYESLGDNLAAAREYNKEIKFAVALLSKSPNDFSVLLRLARAHNGLGDPEKAKEFIDRALRQDPENGEALYVRARIYDKLGQLENAISDLKRARRFFHMAYFIDNYISELEQRKLTFGTIVATEERKEEEVVQPEIEQIAYDIIVHLKNGSVMRGRLIRQSQDFVYFERHFGQSVGEIGIPREDIDYIEAVR